MAILEVFYAPGKLFSSLEGRRGVWILPLILTTALTLAISAFAIHMIGMESIVRQQVQSFRLSPEQMQQAVDRANRPAQIYITYASTIVSVPLYLLGIAGLLTIYALMGSKKPKFSTNFSMTTLAYFPYTLITAVMSILVLLLAPDRSTLDIYNLLATNVGAFVDKETMSAGLYSFLSRIDILTFLEIGLLSYGFSKVNRTSMSFGLFAVGSLWFIYVLIRVGFSMIF